MIFVPEPPDLSELVNLNNRERLLEEIQDDINQTREKYPTVAHVQLEMDRKQAALDEKKKRVIEAKSLFVNPN